MGVSTSSSKIASKRQTKKKQRKNISTLIKSIPYSASLKTSTRSALSKSRVSSRKMKTTMMQRSVHCGAMERKSLVQTTNERQLVGGKVDIDPVHGSKSK